MKKIFLVSLVLLAVVAACSDFDTRDDDLQTKAGASRFVDELMQDFRDGKIGSFRCPDVKWSHIPALLEYGKSTTIVGEVPYTSDRAWAIPASPLSSFMMFQCSEGMFALWMAEAARIHTLNPLASGINGWPSQNPFVQLMNGENEVPSWYVNDPQVQQVVLDAYVKWWKSADGNKTAAKTDPLEGTGYCWH